MDSLWYEEEMFIEDIKQAIKYRYNQLDFYEKNNMIEYKNEELKYINDLKKILEEYEVSYI